MKLFACLSAVLLCACLFSLHSQAQEANNNNETLSERSTLELEYEDLDDYDHGHDLGYGQSDYSNYDTPNLDYAPEVPKPIAIAQSADYPQTGSYQQQTTYQQSTPVNSYQSNSASGYQQSAPANNYQTGSSYQQPALTNNYQAGPSASQANNNAAYPGYTGSASQGYGQGQSSQNSASTYSNEKSNSYKQSAPNTSSYTGSAVKASQNYNAAQSTSGSQYKPEAGKPTAYNTNSNQKSSGAYNAPPKVNAYNAPPKKESYGASLPTQPAYKPKANSNNYGSSAPKYNPASLQTYQNSQGKAYSAPKQATYYKPAKQTASYSSVPKSRNPYNTLPGTYSPESYGGPFVYQGQKYEGQISLYQSYLSSNSYSSYSQRCSKSYKQSARVSSRDLDQAFNWAYNEVQRYDNLEKKQYKQGQYLNITNGYSSSIRHQTPTYISHLTPGYFKEREALLMEFATQYLIQNKCLSRLDASLYLPQIKIQNRPLKDYTCNYLYSHNAGAKTINCTSFAHSPYRSSDGSCNNLYHPYWGKANVCHLRLVASAYDDGVAAPRQSSFRYGAKLPDVRSVSLSAHPEINDHFFYTHLVMAWGQFVNHDITFTPKSQPQYQDGVIDCCRNQGNNYTQLHPQCLPIRLGSNDYLRNKYGKTCFNFVRSAACPLCSLGPRQQMNLVTSFLDLSLTYGNSRREQAELRTFKNGQLKAGGDRYGRESLPKSPHGQKDQCVVNKSGHCFSAGDNRVNQYPGLTAMHTLAQRRHNYHARALQRVNPHWSDERLFQEARRLNIAQFQHITYEEYLPLVFGPTLSAYYSLQSPARSYRGYNGPAYTKYEPYTDPTTWNDYSAAACRYGHSQINGFFSLIHTYAYNGGKSHSYTNQTANVGGYWLRDSFFDPHLMNNGHLDAILRGMVTDRSQVVDPAASTDIKHYLYKGKHEHSGSDLIAFNIQRGRDHGLPAYHVYLDFCFGFKAYGWQDLAKFIPAQQLNVLRSLYADFRDIDLYTGGLSEKKFPDASVGPTFACILGIQYYHIKFGDRYFYSHGYQAGSFTPAQLTSVQNTLSLSHYLCKASDYLGEVQKNPFMPASAYNPLVKCSSLPDLDYSLWKEKY